MDLKTDELVREDIRACLYYFRNSGAAPFEAFGQKFMLLIVPIRAEEQTRRVLGYAPWRIRTFPPIGPEFLVNLEEEL